MDVKMTSIDKFCKRVVDFTKDIDYDTSEIVPTSHVYTTEDVAALYKKYPNVKICSNVTCDFTQRDHEICYEYEQHNADMAKSGTIRIMHKILDFHPVYKTERIYDWWNGKKWITLSQ